LIHAEDVSTGKKTVIYAMFALFSVIFLGAIFFLTTEYGTEQADTMTYSSWLVIAYLAGLSMVVLPCTLPFVFIIVPMTIDRGYKKGLTIALLFGAGMTATITIYGLALAFLGRTAGLSDVSGIMMIVAGSVSFVFGLNRLQLVNIRLPSYSGTPKFLLGRGEYAKAGLMGLLVGNAGVGCTNPLFYIMLIYIMSTGIPEIGASLGFVHGIGRAIPLILVAVLAIIGFNPTRALVAKRVKIERASGFVMIALGAFLIINGTPEGQQWFMEIFLHTVWNDFVEAANLPEQLKISMLPQQFTAETPAGTAMEGMDHEHGHDTGEEEMMVLTTLGDYMVHFRWEPIGTISHGSDIVFNIMFHDPKRHVLLKDVTFDMEVHQNDNLLESRAGIHSTGGFEKQGFRFADSGSAFVKIKNINGKDTEAVLPFEVSRMAHVHHGPPPRYPLELVPVFTGLLIAFPVIWYTVKNKRREVNV